MAWKMGGEEGVEIRNKNGTENYYAIWGDKN